MINLLDLAQELVAIPSVSRNEGAMAQFVADYLSGVAHLEVIRIGDNVIARTNLGRERRVIVAGHLDTVDTPGISTRREGDVLFGLGSADMKGTLAVMLDVSTHLGAPRYDLTWIFYAREEIARSESGLLEIQATQPELLEGDVAILGEPTNALVEAGCQGSVRVKISMAGKSAHTARPWMGVNAIHRVGHLIEDLARVERRTVDIDGVTFGEQIEAVGVGGGHGGNSVPDEAWVTLNLRVAPDRSPTEALALPVGHYLLWGTPSSVVWWLQREEPCRRSWAGPMRRHFLPWAYQLPILGQGIQNSLITSTNMSLIVIWNVSDLCSLKFLVNDASRHWKVLF